MDDEHLPIYEVCNYMDGSMHIESIFLFDEFKEVQLIAGTSVSTQWCGVKSFKVLGNTTQLMNRAVL